MRVIGSDDRPLAGATVQWSITQGQAALDPTQSTTDGSGEAETRVTVGSATGSIIVSASVVDVAPVTFIIAALEPNAFFAVSGGTAHTRGVTPVGDA